MLKELESNFSILENKILKINKKYQNLNEKYNEVLKDFQSLKQKYEIELKKNYELIEEQKKMKLISAISGNSDHNRLMKSHINRLTKEIDVCIKQLKNA